LLTAISPSTIPSGNYPENITIDPNGKYAYVVNGGDNNIFQFLISPSGKLEQLSTIQLGTAGDTHPYHMIIDRSGFYAFIVDNGDSDGKNSQIKQFSIDPNGGFHAMSTPTINVSDMANVMALTGE
jgi:DNA-binding beta-propeller fold protein YncE